jgi:cyclopropane fatty-acyl-phospholipid synthase-like methyltransferase
MINRLRHWLRFNFWYLRKPPWDTGVTPPEVEAFCDSHPAGKALDLGCGSGTNIAYLARKGWRVLGVDFALRAVETARRRLVWEQLEGEVRLGDASRTTQLGEGYNLVLDIGCYHGLGERERREYLAGFPGLLAPGGSFLLYAHLKPNPDARIGLGEGDIEKIAQRLRQAARTDSLDRFGRGATWIEFMRDH